MSERIVPCGDASGFTAKVSEHYVKRTWGDEGPYVVRVELLSGTGVGRGDMTFTEMGALNLVDAILRAVAAARDQQAKEEDQ